MGAAIDLSDQRFGRLLVIAESEAKNNRKMWLCQCDCGNTKAVSTASLRHDNVRSCGCLRKESSIRTAAKRRKPDGKSKTTFYKRWISMIQRCGNPKNPYWKNYGGRGIYVCERWRNSFDAFLADMGNPPTPEHTIERIDNDAGYSPENCRWALRSEQLRNQRRSINVTIDGRTMNAREWSAETGINYQRITRAFRMGGLEKAKALIQEGVA